MNDYSKKLRDPRWQKKRLEILQRDKFTCQHCCHTEKTLTVHHLSYCGNPWDTPNEDLITLCEECHERAEKFVKEARRLTRDELVMNACWWSCRHLDAIDDIGQIIAKLSSPGFVPIFKSIIDLSDLYFCAGRDYVKVAKENEP